jgi:hypothetical protein
MAEALLFDSLARGRVIQAKLVAHIGADLSRYLVSR